MTETRFKKSRLQRSQMKPARRSIERPTLTSTLLIPIPTRCAHKICLHSFEKRSYRAESVEGITSTREEEEDARGGGASKGRQTAKNKDGTENAHQAAAGEEQR